LGTITSAPSQVRIVLAAAADLADLSFEVVHLHGIAHADPALQQEDQTRDEVRHRALQADPGAEPERARQDRDAGEV
jgi:hypothetical protein